MQLVEARASKLLYFVANVIDKVFYVKPVEFFNGSRKFLAWSSLEVEYILVKLESSWNVTCDVSTLFKSEILSFVYVGKRVSEDLELSSEVVLNGVIISR